MLPATVYIMCSGSNSYMYTGKKRGKIALDLSFLMYVISQNDFLSPGAE